MNRVFDAVAVPLVELDREGKIVAFNQCARNNLGDLVIGEAVWAFFNRKKKLKTILENALAGEAEQSAKLATKEAMPTEYLVSATRVSQQDGFGDSAIVLTFEDRTSSRNAKTMRSEFVANVSHEIRSPLTAISGFVETLRGAAKEDSEARELFLNLMSKEVDRMSNLVRDLLSLSHVEVKERSVPRKTVDLDQVVLQAKETAISQAEKRGKTLTVRCDADLPKIRGNHEDLVRVLINLVENAVNYGNEGSEVQLIAEPAEENNPLGKDALKISVVDESEGIPAEEIPHLTQRFYRIDKSRSRDAGGTGLGLAIVKHILNRHRGRLVIESVLGQGSNFQVYLPIPKEGNGSDHP